MKVSLIYWPDDEALKLCLRAIWITSGKNDVPQKPISSGLLSKVLDARHSPIRVLNFAFLFEGIPSNTATHFARHVHAVPFIQSLRNDRQTQLDGDRAPRNTPVNMILYCSAEELMIIANKRLCGRASPMTQLATHMMCDAVLEKFPEFSGLLVPMCLYHGGVCHEIKSCGYAERAQGEVKREWGLEDAVFGVDATMLKEQEPVEPIKSKLSFTHGFNWDIWDCGCCGNQLRLFAKYCDQCGRAVKWDG